MKRVALITLIASLILSACALDPLSTEPEVDIDPDKIDRPATS